MTSGIEPLEVDPIVGILQQVVIGFSKDICSISKTSMYDICAISHGIKLPFPYLIIGLVINEEFVILAKGALVDVGVIMGLRPSLQ